jgi:nitroreductase
MLNAIYKRRSVRLYLDKPVPKDILEEILKAGMYAPSAFNKQPWHFIVCDKEKTVREVRELHHFTQSLETAPVAIIVCGDTELEYMPNFYPSDCAAAVQNILLAAKDLGLDTCWMGIYPSSELEESFSKHFELEENIKPYAMIALGYGNQNIPIPERYNPDKIHYNKW